MAKIKIKTVGIFNPEPVMNINDFKLHCIDGLESTNSPEKREVYTYFINMCDEMIKSLK